MPAVVSNATRIWELNIHWELFAQCAVWDLKRKGVDIWECIRALYTGNPAAKQHVLAVCRPAINFRSRNIALASSPQPRRHPLTPHHGLVTPDTHVILRPEEPHLGRKMPYRRRGSCNLICRLYRRETSERWRWRHSLLPGALCPLSPRPSIPIALHHFHDPVHVTASHNLSSPGQIWTNPPTPPFRLMSHLANLQNFSLVAMSWPNDHAAIFSCGSNNEGTSEPSAVVSFRSSSSTNPVVPTLRTCRVCKCLAYSSFISLPLSPVLYMCMCLATSVYLSWFHYLWFVFVFFSAHLQNPRTFLIQVIAHTPPLAPQGCTLYDIRSLPPLSPLASLSTSVILCLFIAPYCTYH